MKQFISFIVIMAMLGSVVCPGYAQGNGPIEKLVRGATNLVTSPKEILHSVRENRKGDGMAAGKSHGLLEGLTRFVVKATTSLVEIATFPFPWPNNYSPILESTESFKTKKN